MVVVGSGNDGAVELLSSHHTQIRTGLEEAKAIEAASARKDSDRLAELSKLAAAASKQAKSAQALRNNEKQKLDVSPSSKVDAESMLASEAAKKAANLKQDVKSLHREMKELAKKLRKEHHAARQKQRLLKKVDAEDRDGDIALHDREMKVLEARHDVENAAKAGDVSVLRDAQERLKTRKAIAKGARAQEEENKKMRDQIAARARLLRKRAQLTQKKIQSDQARAHNLILFEREEKAAAKAIGARSNLLRDSAALKAARSKYKSLAELLGDANSDHSQVRARSRTRTCMHASTGRICVGAVHGWGRSLLLGFLKPETLPNLSNPKPCMCDLTWLATRAGGGDTLQDCLQHPHVEGSAARRRKGCGEARKILQGGAQGGFEAFDCAFAR